MGWDVKHRLGWSVSPSPRAAAARQKSAGAGVGLSCEESWTAVQEWIDRYPTSSFVRLDSVTCRAAVLPSFLSLRLCEVYSAQISAKDGACYQTGILGPWALLALTNEVGSLVFSSDSEASPFSVRRRKEARRCISASLAPQAALVWDAHAQVFYLGRRSLGSPSSRASLSTSLGKPRDTIWEQG